MRAYYIVKETTLMHCGDFNGKKVKKGGNICIYMSDSFCCILESNTKIVKKPYSIKIN